MGQRLQSCCYPILGPIDKKTRPKMYTFDALAPTAMLEWGHYMPHKRQMVALMLSFDPSGASYLESRHRTEHRMLSVHMILIGDSY